jgi:hypothetical protein
MMFLNCECPAIVLPALQSPKPAHAGSKVLNALMRGL